MASRSKLKAPTPDRVARMRDLLEQFRVGPAGSPALKIDRDKGVIYGVKVLGRYSKNNHGLAEAENGSEYTPGCMRQALPMYEGAKVKLNHPPDRSQPARERDVNDIFGVLRNARIESEDDGVRADLHYRKHHDITPDVLDDVERQLGLWGLSHNAAAKRERFDRGSRRLVIEELALVRSVDLVDKPATNRNLWESEESPVKSATATTFRELLESRRAKWSKARRGWCDLILEDDVMAPAMDAPVEAEGGNEEDALWAGFQAAIVKVLDGYKAGEIDAKQAGKKIADWIKAHDKLAGSEEPEEVEESEDDDKPKDKDKQEGEELVALRSEKAARALCESLALANPTSTQVEAVAGMKTDKGKRELVESFKGKPAAPGLKSPKSAAPGQIKTPGQKAGGQQDRETPEGEVVPADEGMRTLLGG